jgi:4-amino-4-deoxy-L-arabinose transferase-like glycosyltransferase
VLSRLRKYLLFPGLALAVIALYLYQLDGTGVLSTDEPRYLAVGRAMAASHDWVMPVLWGKPWFEKPPLLYWLVALGARAGLGMELCGRLPVALLSLAFLAGFFELLRREFGFRVAATATMLLACSAGWLAFSSLALTDAPLAICFSTAVLLLLPLIPSERGSSERRPERRFSPAEVNSRFALAGVATGLAVLAKGLVPILLLVPAAWYLRHYARRWWIGLAAMLIVAAPWYLAVYLRAGFPFIEQLFLKHHLARIYSASIDHVQPFYFYIPALLGSVFPWTPLLLLLVHRQTWRRTWTEPRRQYLLVTVVFGFLCFSAILNKLPGYLLPLLPLLFILIGAWFEERHLADLGRAWMVACAALMALVPWLSGVIPRVLAGQHEALAAFSPTPTLIAFSLLPLGFAAVAKRSWLGPILIFCSVAAALYLKESVYPVVDRENSARGLWRELEPEIGTVCDAGLHRAWQYQFAFYLGQPPPPCAPGRSRWSLSQHGNERPTLSPLP